MPISDIFTTPFLICLGICLLLLGLLGMYFTQKIMEQNHKITSMFELVSTMAEEMNAIRANIMIPQFQPQFNMVSTPIGGQSESLIPVSDDEDDEDDDDDDDEDDEDDDEEDEEDEEEDVLKIKSINFNNLESSAFNINNEVENLEELQILDEEDDYDDDDDDDDDEEEDDNDENSNINITEELNLVDSELEEFTNLDFEKVANGENAPDAHLESKPEDLSFLKTINLESLEEPKSFQVVDYKKLSLAKLKSLVVEKGLVTDSTKMKKNELLNLLGSD